MDFSQMCSDSTSYKPFVDYFGLSNLAWKSDLMAQLDSLMEPPLYYRDTQYHSELSTNVRDDDSLDVIRRDARNDFQYNGVDADMDEVDVYQTQLRQRSAAEAILLETSDNPVLVEYLAQREKRRTKKSTKFCVFCKNNGEPSSMYQGHVLKDTEGRITCPVLRRYTCPICGVSGDNAHTIRYCPKGEGDSLGLSLLTRLGSSADVRRF